MIWTNASFETKDHQGRANGRAIRVWEATDPTYKGFRPRQVYITEIAATRMKGPHLHHKRASVFCCISGSVVISLKVTDGWANFPSGPDSGYASVYVPRGVPAAIVNTGSVDAVVVVISDSLYDPADQKEVEF